MSRTKALAYGGLIVRVAARLDQIHFKLYAAVDGGPDNKHVQDLRALAATGEELIAAARWARTREMCRQALAALGAEVPDDL